MHCKHAVINGTNVLVNFREKNDRVAILIQKIDEPLESMLIESLDISDYDSCTAILNKGHVLQMDQSDLAYIYARFNLIRH